MKKKIKLYLISHTHWDREWYQDFQGYRYRLVRMMDDLIENLENNEQYKCFHLDGQTIVLQDYLEIRPENEVRLKKLIKCGRIIIGPWYVMPDEFLVSGESIIKNIQIGYKICENYGVPSLKNGYVTDIFGHNSQMPQILKGFDICSSILFRGIGDYDKDAFIWQSPDGSQVHTHKLDKERSYSNFYFAVRYPYETCDFDEKDAIDRLKQLIERSKLAATSDDMLLMMDGVDHLDVEQDIPKLIKLFEDNIPDIEFVHTSLDEYFEKLIHSDIKLEIKIGALYQIGKTGMNNLVLKNVLSSVISIKQENDHCESMLIKYVQPLDAFFDMYKQQLKPLGKNDYVAVSRKAYIDKAWDYLIQNHPHDSICGCSMSDVHRDNLYRFRQSRKISELMIKDILSSIADNVNVQQEGKDGNILIFNPSQRQYTKVSVLKLYVPVNHQNNFRFYNYVGKEIDVQLLDKKLIQQPNHRLRKIIGFDMLEEWTVAAEINIPALGYTVLSYDNLIQRGPENYSYAFTEVHQPKRLMGSLRTGHNTFDNGVFELKINRDGTLKIRNKETQKVYDNLLLFENSADGGDGWNYRKILLDSVYMESNGNFQYSIESEGPLACKIKINRFLKIPCKLANDGQKRNEEMVEIKITTWVTILKDSPVVSFKTELDNIAEHHRLRVHFPTSIKTDKFYTKTPFDMYEWNIKADDYSTHHENETFVHPSQGITLVSDGKDSASVYTKGLYEVEVTDDDEHAIAVSLFRSPLTETGMTATDYTKLFEKLTFEYAFSISNNDLTSAMIEGEKWRSDLFSHHFSGDHSGNLSNNCSFLKINADEVILSSIRLLDSATNTCELRFYDVKGEKNCFSVNFTKEIQFASYNNLYGKIVSEATFEGKTLYVNINPHEIVTINVSLR